MPGTYKRRPYNCNVFSDLARRYVKCVHNDGCTFRYYLNDISVIASHIFHTIHIAVIPSLYPFLRTGIHSILADVRGRVVPRRSTLESGQLDAWSCPYSVDAEPFWE